jgi:prophage DNA circulation protein
MSTITTPKLETASFRGVLFTCTSHEVKAGRRHADHIYPQRDLGYHEDLGRADREFTLSAYLVGDNAFSQRDRLLEAFEARGPGELFHPWLGRLTVVAKPSTFRESRSTRRLVELSLTFVEAGRASVVTAWRDTRASLRTAAKAVAPAAEVSLGSRRGANPAQYAGPSALGL